MNNLHISLTPFKNESRVLKQVGSISKLDFIDAIFIAALHEEGLEQSEIIKNNIFLKRFYLLSRKLPKNLFVQIFKYVEFVFRVVFFYRNKNIKMVNIHAVSLLPLGVLLKILYGAKLVYDTHELETEVVGSSDMRKKLAKWLERICIQFADQAFVVSENIADWYRDTYSMVRPPVILNSPSKKTCATNNKFREYLGIKEDQTIFLYQGGLAEGRGVELILEAFEERNSCSEVVVFMGYGEFESLIREKAKTTQNIYFYPAVSPDVLLEYTSSADIGVHVPVDICLSYYYSMPNKLFEYAMAGLPVIVSEMKEMKEFVEKYKMGMALKEYTATELNRLIDKMLMQDVKQMQQNALKAARENSWEEQEKKMLSAYKRLYGAKL